jgi:hypothetical protein
MAAPRSSFVLLPRFRFLSYSVDIHTDGRTGVVELGIQSHVPVLIRPNGTWECFPADEGDSIRAFTSNSEAIEFLKGQGFIEETEGRL